MEMTDDDICLVVPDEGWEGDAVAFRQEFWEAGERVICGSALLDQMPDYAEWLELVRANACRETVPCGWVLSEVFFAVRKRDHRVVGIIDLRHELNEFLRDFGHCGYSVRPGERGKGYGKAMLRLLCEHAQCCGMGELQLSCEEDNAVSRRVIVSAGGKYVREFTHQGKRALVYMLSLQ